MSSVTTRICYQSLQLFDKLLEAGAPATQEFKSEKSTLRALEEIESGNVTIHPDPEGKREAVRRRIEEERRLREEEEKKIKEQIAKEKEEGEKI